jgi:20S proteasome alpha/beta subunit
VVFEADIDLYSSPQGRIFQVEYASEAVKQGSVVVGIVSKTHAVLVALKVCIPDALNPKNSINSLPSVTQKNSPRTKRKSSPSTNILV